MKFGQLIEYNVRNIFLKKLYKNQGGETNSSPLLCFKKALYGVNGGGLHLSSNIFL